MLIGITITLDEAATHNVARYIRSEFAGSDLMVGWENGQAFFNGEFDDDDGTPAQAVYAFAKVVGGALEDVGPK